MLWLAQDQCSDCWTGVTAAVNMVLDWLEHHLNAGKIPCFFWPAINLVGGRSPAELEDSIITVQLMRRQTTNLLLTCCDRMGFGLDAILEGGSESLSERELRLRLARELVWAAVYKGTLLRPSAPCWEHWYRAFMPALCRLSQHRLFQWMCWRSSGTYWQQCQLLQALAVAPDDLVANMRLLSSDGVMFTWSAAPLLALLNEMDLEFILCDPDAVADWCRQQLCRPPAERPAGLTAELNTPRGRAELLLQPELLLQASREAEPIIWRVVWQRQDQINAEKWRANFLPHFTYQQCREEAANALSRHLESGLLHCLPELDSPTAAATARLWRQGIQHLLSGDRLREAYTAATTRWPDRWRLAQYLVQDIITEGKTCRRRRPSPHRPVLSHLPRAFFVPYMTLNCCWAVDAPWTLM